MEAAGPVPLPSGTSATATFKENVTLRTTLMSTAPTPTPASETVPPQMRLLSAVATDTDEGKVYMLGGADSADVLAGTATDAAVRCSSSVFSYSLFTGRWDPEGSVPAMPEGLCCHTATYTNRTIWVFGGTNINPYEGMSTDNVNNLMYVYDIALQVWTTSLSGRNLVVFGGQNHFYNTLGDLHLIELSESVNVTSRPTIDAGLPRTMAEAVQLRVGGNIKPSALFVYGGLHAVTNGLSSQLVPYGGNQSWFAWDLGTLADITYNSSLFEFGGYAFAVPTTTTTSMFSTTPDAVLDSATLTTATSSSRHTSLPKTTMGVTSMVSPFPSTDPKYDGPTTSDDGGRLATNFGFVANTEGTMALLYGGGVTIDNTTVSNKLWMLNATVQDNWMWSELRPTPIAGSESVELPTAVYVSGVWLNETTVFFFIPWDSVKKSGGLLIFNPLEKTFYVHNSTTISSNSTDIAATTSVTLLASSNGPYAPSPPVIGGLTAGSLALISLGFVGAYFVMKRGRSLPFKRRPNPRKLPASTATPPSPVAASVSLDPFRDTANMIPLDNVTESTTARRSRQSSTTSSNQLQHPSLPHSAHSLPRSSHSAVSLTFLASPLQTQLHPPIGGNPASSTLTTRGSDEDAGGTSPRAPAPAFRPPNRTVTSQAHRRHASSSALADLQIAAAGVVVAPSSADHALPSYEDAVVVSPRSYTRSFSEGERNSARGNGGGDGGVLIGDTGEMVARGPNGETITGQGRVVTSHVPVGKEEIELRVGDIVGLFEEPVAAYGSGSTSSMIRGYNFDSGRSGLFPRDNYVLLPRSLSHHSVNTLAGGGGGSGDEGEVTLTGPVQPVTANAYAGNVSWWRRQAALAFRRAHSAGALGVAGAEEENEKGGGGSSVATDGDDIFASMLAGTERPVVTSPSAALLGMPGSNQVGSVVSALRPMVVISAPEGSAGVADDGIHNAEVVDVEEGHAEVAEGGEVFMVSR
ncbi:hypothetical protein HK101_002739 [Irineochytrium annulatum]|nr:hypothetical protein HK101_002739 [Irineochytrium annulatum]